MKRFLKEDERVMGRVGVEGAVRESVEDLIGIGVDVVSFLEGLREEVEDAMEDAGEGER